MQIAFVEISRFRKLHAVRVELDPERTLLVGANNSGKSSAMAALRRFLVPKERPIDLWDVSVSSWKALNELAAGWCVPTDEIPPGEDDRGLWRSLLPALDIWFDVPVTAALLHEAGLGIHIVSPAT